MDIGAKIPQSFFDHPEKIQKLLDLQMEMNGLLSPEGDSAGVQSSSLPACPVRGVVTKPVFIRSSRPQNERKKAKDKQRWIEKCKQRDLAKEQSKSNDSSEKTGEAKRDVNAGDMKALGKENQSTVQEEVIPNKNDKQKLKQFRDFLTNI